MVGAPTIPAQDESGELLRLAVQVGGIGIFDTDLERKRTRFSPELCVILGLPTGTEMDWARAWLEPISCVSEPLTVPGPPQAANAKIDTRPSSIRFILFLPTTRVVASEELRGAERVASPVRVARTHQSPETLEA